MKRLCTLMLALSVVQIAAGQVTLKVYEGDGVTPFDSDDEIMVGTKLTLVISSDSNDYWSGGLFIRGDDRAFATLEGRDYDANTRDWTGSHYEDAGELAKVTAWHDSYIWGYDLLTFYPVDNNSGDNSTEAGDWFVIDYYADEAGDCNLEFYDYSISWDDPNYFITFSHVPTRDLNWDDVVNFVDYAIFSSRWNATACNDPNWCDGADLERDGDVDYNDLALFADYWLWPTSINESNADYLEDPNITYTIVDGNGLSEITVDVNESVTLYVDIATTEANDVKYFDIEVDISDANLGFIDNTEYPNGTAQILAEPNRDSYWDYWGPGLEQEEGIRLFGMTTGCAIADGHLAGFVFTCEGQGDVTLELTNWVSVNTDGKQVYPKLESIVIHQVDPNAQMEGEGMSMSSGPQEEPDIDEVEEWLESLWHDYKDIREMYSKKEWDEFINSVIDSYQPF
ncbi:MAG: hypothetical protein ACYS8I_02785 [Planctomycetota bacterium]